MLTIIDNKELYSEFLQFMNDPEVSILEQKDTKDGILYKFNTDDKILVKRELLIEDKYQNDLIFGKDKTKNVVNVSLENDALHIFTENNGKIDCLIRPANYWIVSRNPQEDSTRLNGKNYYNHISIFNKYNEFINTRKYLYNKDIWSIYDTQEANLILKGITYYKDLKVTDVSVLSFDIETVGKNIDENSKVLIISNTFRSQGKIIKKLFKYDDYDTDGEMINAWCKWVCESNPSIMIGHNIFGFDFPYLNYCYQREYKENLRLGRDDASEIQINDYTSSFRKDGSQSYDYTNIKIFGRDIVDTFFLAIKFDIKRKYVSYALKQIIKQEKLEKEDRQHYDASKIAENYKKPLEWKKIIQYGKDDADDGLALFDLMIPSFFYYAQSIPKTLQQIINTASGSQINSFLVRSYLSENKALPKSSEVKNFEGGISIGIPGVYEGVAKADVASMYPSIILEHKLFDKMKDPDGNFLKMVDYFTKERLENKALSKKTGDRYYKDVEQAMKIIINSAYGLCNTPGLLFNAPYMGAFITKKSREVLLGAVKWATGIDLIKNTNEDDDEKWIIKKINEGQGYSLVNVDTDSFSFYKENDLITQKTFNQFLVDLNSIYPETIRWDDDGIYDNVLILKAKNYVLKQGNEITYKGSALIDQKKEPAMLEFLRKATDLIMNKQSNKILDLYHNYVKEAYEIKDISRWAVKKTVTEKVLENDRTNEKKIREAIGNTSVQEGDKIWIFTAKPIQIPLIVKGEAQFKKDGITPKTKSDNPLKLISEWSSGDEDEFHYIDRVHSTAKILENVIDINQFVKYNNSKNRHLLETL